MKLGEFDADTPALITRIRAHEKHGRRDLNDWILRHTSVSPGFEVLDMGCGPGKETVPLAEMVGQDGRVAAFDVSSQETPVISTSTSVAEILGRRP